MNAFALIIVATLPIVGQASGQPEAAWRLRSLPAPSLAAQALLLQADSDAAPEWAVFDGARLTVADISSDYPPLGYSIPSDASLFDFRDTDRDGRPELAVLRSGRLEYWRDAGRSTQDAPHVTIEDPLFAAFSFGLPRPFPLFVERRGEDFLSVPLGHEPPLWSLEGIRVSPPVKELEETLGLSQFHVWETSTPPVRDSAVTEFRVSQLYENTEVGAPRAVRAGGTLRAREAAAADPEDWPSFTLERNTRVLYALAPPNYRDTLVRIERGEPTNPAAPRRPSTSRRFPGVVIAPGDAGVDLNGDGFADLLLWHTPSASTSANALVRAAQTGTWDVTFTVHLYEPFARKFAARPIEWFESPAPVMNVLQGGVRGPFEYSTIEDLDGDGAADLVCTGAGNELIAWRFSDKGQSRPWLYAKFDEPIDEIVLTAHVPAYRWLGIARSAQEFHLFALPQH